MQTRKRTLTADYGSVEFGVTCTNARPGQADELNEAVADILRQMVEQFLDYVDVVLCTHTPGEETNKERVFRGSIKGPSYVYIKLILNGASIATASDLSCEIATMMQVIVIDTAQTRLESSVQHMLTAAKP